MSDDTPRSLTVLERLQLRNQFAILEKLDDTESEYYAMCREVMENGYTLFYGEVFQGFSDELSEEDCQYVYDVLDMYRDLRYSYDELKDKTGIDADNVKFRGFDGNNETELMGFIRFLKEQGRWDETLKDCGMNTHCPTTDRYRRMLAIWKPIREKRNPLGRVEGLTADEIKQVLYWTKSADPEAEAREAASRVNLRGSHRGE